MKKLISFILCLVTVVSVIPMGTMAQENPFPDVPADAWYAEYIVKANEMGLMQGNEKGEMMPTKPITRAEAVEILYNNCDRLYDYPEVTEIPFTDVKKSDWFYDAVKWAYCEGFIQGVGNNKFKPNDYVTRQDFVVMIQRYYHFGGIYDAKNAVLVLEKTVDFKDFDEISDYASSAVDIFTGVFYYNYIGETARHYTSHIMSGYNGYFMPKANCSRAEAAKILVNFYNTGTYAKVYGQYSYYKKYCDIPFSVTSIYKILLSDGNYIFKNLWGIDSQYFGANEYITRDDLSDLIRYFVASYHMPEYEEFSFPDSRNKYSEYAYQNGYMLLREDGTFAPNDYVTVEEALYFINQFNKKNSFSITVDRSNEYSDFNEVSPEYKDAVKLAVSDISKGNWNLTPYFVTTENGKILPQNNITRLQFFEMVLVEFYW